MVERPELLHGKTKRVKTGCGNLYITLNSDGDKPAEVFIRLGKAGGCASSQGEVIGRLLTVSLRNGVDISLLIQQLQGVGCHMPVFVGMGIKHLSCADAVAHALISMTKTKPELRKEQAKNEENAKNA